MQRGAQAASEPGGQRACVHGERRSEQADPAGAGAVSGAMTVDDFTAAGFLSQPIQSWYELYPVGDSRPAARAGRWKRAALCCGGTGVGAIECERRAQHLPVAERVM